MGVKVRLWKGAWWLDISHENRRVRRRVGVGKEGKKAADLAAIQISAKLTSGDTACLVSPAPAVPPITFPRLRDALPDWIDRQQRAGEIRASTAVSYRSRLAKWAYLHSLPDGRLLGDLSVNEVTREMLGAVIWRVKEAGRSLAVMEAIRNPLRGYYTSLIETEVFPGPNPAADLRYFIGKGAHLKARRSAMSYFAQEEGPQLVATAKALFPRWRTFILTGLLGGLRWGESAALHKT